MKFIGVSFLKFEFVFNNINDGLRHLQKGSRNLLERSNTQLKEYGLYGRLDKKKIHSFHIHTRDLSNSSGVENKMIKVFEKKTKLHIFMNTLFGMKQTGLLYNLLF